jgi:hypothetical protein
MLINGNQDYLCDNFAVIPVIDPACRVADRGRNVFAITQESAEGAHRISKSDSSRRHIIVIPVNSERIHNSAIQPAEIDNDILKPVIVSIRSLLDFEVGTQNRNDLLQSSFSGSNAVIIIPIGWAAYVLVPIE